MNFEIEYTKRKEIINQKLKVLINYKNIPQQLKKSIQYAVLGDGKRLRPILCLSSYEIFKGSYSDIVEFACGIELIHNYSLIHDDLPAIDNDDFRRGKPTLHKKFGEDIALLTGDALLTEAFNIFSRQNFPSNKLLSAINIIARNAGIFGMVSGQVLDIVSKPNKKFKKNLKKISLNKTSALIKASLLTGAILADAEKEKLTIISKFGQHFGLMFQIIDDILDYEKLKTDKLSFVTVYGLNQSKKLAEYETKKALKYLEYFDKLDFLKLLTLSSLNRIS